MRLRPLEKQSFPGVFFDTHADTPWWRKQKVVTLVWPNLNEQYPDCHCYPITSAIRDKALTVLRKDKHCYHVIDMTFYAGKRFTKRKTTFLRKDNFLTRSTWFRRTPRSVTNFLPLNFTLEMEKSERLEQYKLNFAIWSLTWRSRTLSRECNTKRWLYNHFKGRR